MSLASLRDGLVLAICPSINGGGGIVPDLSGRANNATLSNMGATEYAAGRYGPSFRFTGTSTSQVITLPNSQSLDILDWEISLSAWFFAFSSPVTDFPFFVNKSSGLSDGQYFLGVNFGRQRFIVGGTEVFDVYDPPTNVWVHYAGTCRVSDMVSYRNGVAVASGTRTGTQTTTGAAVLGRLTWATGLTLNGLLDDIRVYRRALTQHEIRLLASEPGIGLRQDRDRNTFYQFPSGARRKRILTGMP